MKIVEDPNKQLVYEHKKGKQQVLNKRWPSHSERAISCNETVKERFALLPYWMW